MRTPFIPLSLPRLSWLVALGCACFAVPGNAFAQQPAVRATVAQSGNEVDAALQNSLNLSVRAIAGLQTDKVTPWARIDRDRLNAVLRAFGFYEGNVHIVVDRHSEFPREANGPTEAKRALDEARIQLSFVPVLGPLYRVRSVRIVEAGNGEARTPADGEAEMLERMRGERATAERLAQLEAEWLERQRNAGRAFAIVTNRKVSPDASSHRLDVTL